MAIVKTKNHSRWNVVSRVDSRYDNVTQDFYTCSLDDIDWVKFRFIMARKTLWTREQKVIIDKQLYVFLLPQMNPDYLTEMNLWDVIDRKDDEFKNTLFD